MALGILFADPHIVEAPPYQRHFAWSPPEASRLLENIIEAMGAEGEAGESAAHYFIGAMLFIEKGVVPIPGRRWKPRRSIRLLEVVDGLQRLTTLTILFCLLRDRLSHGRSRVTDRLLAAIAALEGTRQRMALRDVDEEFFQSNVRRQGATDLAAAGEPPSPAASRILEVRNSFSEALREHEPAQLEKLAAFVLDRCHVVVVITKGIDRAHHIFTVLNTTGKPLARNDVLKAMLLGGAGEASVAQATANWDAAEARAAERFESVFSHIRVMYGRTSVPVISGIMGIATEQGGAERFIEGVLQPAVDTFEDIRKARHSGSPQSEEIVRLLRYLGWLQSADWVPPVMLWWLQKGSDAGELAWFLGQLDRLVYGLRILGMGAQKRATRMGAVVTAIRKGQDLRAPGSPLALLREELRTINYNLRDLHARNPQVARLVLLRLNDHIAGEPQGFAVTDLTVEHLVPRKPGINSQWRIWLPEHAEREQLMECLGNLVLATREQNDRAGNSDFARKKEILFNTPGVPFVALNEEVRRHAEWKAPEIRAREADLLARLYALWGFGVPLPRTGVPGNGGARRRRAVAEA